MPKLQSESFGAGNSGWLGSAHGIGNARSSSLKVSSFTKATHYPNGYLPGGTAVNAASEKDLKPYTGTAGEVLGFILFDQPVAPGVDVLNVPVLRHGTINIAQLPDKTFTAPTGATTFVFVKGA